MNWLNNLNTRSKLIAAFSVVLMLLAGIITSAWNDLNAVYDVERTLDDSLNLRVNIHNQRAAMLSAILAPSKEKSDSYLEEIREISRKNEALVSSLQQQVHNDPALRNDVEQIHTSLREIASVRESRIVPLIQEHQDNKTAEIVFKTAEVVFDPKLEKMEQIRESVRHFSDILDKKSGIYLKRAHFILISLGSVAILVAIVAVIVLTSTIATPLQKITAAADKIAQGDINVDLAQQVRRDEIGQLDQAFLRMCESLQGFSRRAQQISQGDLTSGIQPRSERDILGNSFATMSRDLRALMKELLDAVNVLASSATEIMASTSQLAASAAETASAVAETSATVEEVKQTSHLTSQKARQVADEAQRAVEVAKSGKVAVDDTVTGMNGIRSQMDIVAESILNLSTQGQAIGEIIATVDDLAAQSKLLAVNASIEAAKAGDEGKGFSVVAQEVRSLAEQSKQATNQVRGILSDIQKATSNAVLATEQGGKSVDAGVKQSAASGHSIRALSDTVSLAAQASLQIAASSQQQFTGMDQVVMAMTSIKSASEQTVASTKQAEAAAKQLHALGLKLKQLVERFQV